MMDHPDKDCQPGSTLIQLLVGKLCKGLGKKNTIIKGVDGVQSSQYYSVLSDISNSSETG
jgi:hypothetical protein